MAYAEIPTPGYTAPVPIRTACLRWLAIAALLTIAGCASAPPPPAVSPVPPPHPPPDWFRRTLADARHARLVHLKAGDKAGASRAYAALMVPACERVERQGPAKYLARCRAILHPAAAAASSAMPLSKNPPSKGPASARTSSPPQAGTPARVDDATCDPDRDDSNDTPAQITACSD